MNWLVVGLFSEGATDRRFLPTILYRLIWQIISEIGWDSVEIQEDLIIYREMTNAERADRACSDKDYVDLFFVHSDASSNQYEDIHRNISSTIAAIACNQCEISLDRIVPVITVREMESWALVDPDAIAKACLSTRWPQSIPMSWNPQDCERIADPKAALDQIVRDLFGGRRGRKAPRSAMFFDQIAEEIELERLLSLTYFKIFSKQLRDSLLALKDAHTR